MGWVSRFRITCRLGATATVRVRVKGFQQQTTGDRQGEMVAWIQRMRRPSVQPSSALQRVMLIRYVLGRGFYAQELSVGSLSQCWDGVALIVEVALLCIFVLNGQGARGTLIPESSEHGWLSSHLRLSSGDRAPALSQLNLEPWYSYSIPFHHIYPTYVIS